jgi:hypothetical protein
MRADETRGARHQNTLVSYPFHHCFFLTYTCTRSRLTH